MSNPKQIQVNSLNFKSELIELTSDKLAQALINKMFEPKESNENTTPVNAQKSNDLYKLTSAAATKQTAVKSK
jgi:hypothetical protein